MLPTSLGLTAMADERAERDGLDDHQMLWLHGEVEEGGRRLWVRLNEERLRVELATVGDPTATISAGTEQGSAVVHLNRPRGPGERGEEGARSRGGPGCSYIARGGLAGRMRSRHAVAAPNSGQALNGGDKGVSGASQGSRRGCGTAGEVRVELQRGNSKGGQRNSAAALAMPAVIKPLPMPISAS